MRRLLATLAAIGLLLAIGGCQRAPEAQAPAPVIDHVAEARQALAAQQWAVAAPHLRAALQKDPNNYRPAFGQVLDYPGGGSIDLSALTPDEQAAWGTPSLFLHYNLALCATWLDLRDEAIREFEWVVTHAPGDAAEAKTARQWLADNRGGTRTGAAESAADDPKRGDSGLHGLVMWAEPGRNSTPQSRQQLVLAGLRDSPTKELIYVVRADRDGRYEFKRIVPGPYQLKGEAAGGRTRWRLKVELKPVEDLALDLTPENSTQRRDDFPGG